MGLNGNLEDVPLIDILQIIAFIKKSGYLLLESPFGQGAIVFRDGRVMCAYSWSTLNYLRRIGGSRCDGEKESSLIREQIETSVRELTGLREGRFDYQPTDDIGTELNGVDISTFLLHEGIDPQQLLLELTQEIDEERRDTAALLESSVQLNESAAHSPAEPVQQEAAPPEPSPAAKHIEPDSRAHSVGRDASVVLVDDEPQVLEVLEQELRSSGYRVRTADNPADGARIAHELVDEGGRVLVVADLRMPTSTRKSFFGGFELVRRLNKNGSQTPVLLMAESLSEKARKRAVELGIRKVAFKPSLTKLDPEQYESDLRSFASLLLRQLDKMGVAGAPKTPVAAEPEGESEDGSFPLEFLTSMTEQLANPNRSVDVTRMVLQVAARYFERGILFLIKGEHVSGLAGFGLATSDEESKELVRKLQIEIGRTGPFAKVFNTRKCHHFGAEVHQELEAILFTHVGRGRSRECAMLPMLNRGEVLLILYGDNATSGKPLGKLRGLELFIVQAGMALENAFLHQKLQSLDSKLSVSGP